MNTKIILFIFITCVLFFVPKVSFASSVMEGKINSILEENGNYQKLEIVFNDGNKIEIENGVYDSANNVKYKLNDKVVVTDGMITDYVRRPILYFLFAIFTILTLIIAGKWGLYSLIGMFYSFYIIFSLILPLITKGFDPVISAIVGSVIIIPITFCLSHGLNKKTFNAIIGTIISMIIIGLLSLLFVNLTKLSGFSSEEAGFLQYQLEGIINIKGLLLAGIIIASLGVMDDITVSQSSIVLELKLANPKLSKKELFLRSMRVGKDHISSMVNTLILVYTGASLPLLLLFVNSPHPFSEIINYEIIAEEVVRTMVGSIGLILAVPITTYIAVYSLKK